MRRLIIFLASGGFVGYIPVASGTFGTLVALPLFWLYEPFRHLSLPLYLVAYVAMVAAACWIAGRAEAAFAEHDSHKIVIDEIVGYLGATLFLAPTWEHTLLAFFVFRATRILAISKSPRRRAQPDHSARQSPTAGRMSRRRGKNASQHRSGKASRNRSRTGEPDLPRTYRPSCANRRGL
jgi:phosphatidylglycerophosphatase A